MESIRIFVDNVLFTWVLPEPVTMRLSRQMIRYLFYGSISTLLDWGIFYTIAVVLGAHYFFAASVSFLFSSTSNFVTNKYLNFQNKSVKLASQFATHFSIGLSALFLTYVLLYFFIDIFGLHQMFAKVCTSGVLAFYGFFAHKHITFNDRHFGN